MDAKTSIVRSIEALQDQLDQFPLESVIRLHDEQVQEAMSVWQERLASLDNPGRRYWNHPAELMYDEVGILLGAKFVLLQAGITETISIIKRAYSNEGKKISKQEILNSAADFDSTTKLSLPTIIDTAANYYKHRFEWLTPWTSNMAKNQVDTIQQAMLLGMHEQNDLADNLLCAEDTINRNCQNEQYSGNFVSLVIGEWRERWADRLRTRF